jgi:hypothetical protein
MAKGNMGRYQPARKVMGKGKAYGSNKSSNKLATARKGSSPLGSKTSGVTGAFGAGRMTTKTGGTRSSSKTRANAGRSSSRIGLTTKSRPSGTHRGPSGRRRK